MLDYIRGELVFFFVIFLCFSSLNLSYGNQNSIKKLADTKLKIYKEAICNGVIYKSSVRSRYSAIGLASWYGKKFHNKKTAAGELFNKNHYTAAHRSMPFNTMVVVTNVKNNKSVIVKISDRGPFNNRIIDVSEAAARKLDFIKEGVTQVRIEVLSSDKK